MPAAARATDLHECPLSDGPKPHKGGPVLPGETTVLIGFKPAARMTDPAVCVGVTDIIVGGEATVLIGDLPAARMGDQTMHGGMISSGCPTVMIGSSPQANTLLTDKPFCEKCEASKRLRRKEDATKQAKADKKKNKAAKKKAGRTPSKADRKASKADRKASKADRKASKRGSAK